MFSSCFGGLSFARFARDPGLLGAIPAGQGMPAAWLNLIKGLETLTRVPIHELLICWGYSFTTRLNISAQAHPIYYHHSLATLYLSTYHIHQLICIYQLLPIYQLAIHLSELR